MTIVERPWVSIYLLNSPAFLHSSERFVGRRKTNLALLGTFYLANRDDR